jgi:hypothetical protein
MGTEIKIVRAGEDSRNLPYFTDRSSQYVLITYSNNYRKVFFVTVQEPVIAYCRCGEAVKLFRFLLSPYILGRTV